MFKTYMIVEIARRKNNKKYGMLSRVNEKNSVTVDRDINKK